MHTNILFILGLSVIFAVALGYLARFLKQPLLLAYIAAGFLIGPEVLGWIHEFEDISLLSELGLAFLLFIVGLEIDIKKLVKLGRVSIVVGLAQVGVSLLLGYAVVFGLGFSGLPAMYLAVAAAFSSTMIVVKLLYDKYELDTIHGRITLSILLLQDILAVVVLALQPTISQPSFIEILKSAAEAGVLVVASFLLAKYLLPRMFRYAAKSPELLLLTSIAWCFLVCGGALAANFSIAMGALIAGISISSFPYNLDVIAKIQNLRDFFVTLFFISLGMQINMSSSTVLWGALLLSLAIVISRWISIIPSLFLQNFGTRVGILCSINLAQASEFSLVIATVGFSLGHISNEIISLIAISLIITSTLSTYSITSNHAIAKFGMRVLARVGMKDTGGISDGREEPASYDVILLGCHRVGSSVLNALSRQSRSFLVVDFNPEVLDKLRNMNIACAYGDISHMETLHHIGLERAKVIISSISDDFLHATDNLTIVRHLRKLNSEAAVIASAETATRALDMYRAGASYVLLPRHAAADRLEEILEDLHRRNLSDFTREQMAELERRPDLT